ERPQQEGPANQAASIEDPCEEEGGGLGQEGPVDVDKGDDGRNFESGPSRRAHDGLSGVELTHRPIRPVKSRASASCAASAMTRTIGSVLLARTWTHRSSQSNRKPSRRSARASGNAAAIRSQSAAMSLETASPAVRIGYWS